MTRLLAELPGRIWEGKTSVLDAVAALTSACPRQIDATAVVDALLTESQRAKTDYRKSALDAVDAVLVAIA
jgi:proteasome component ECM29